MDGWMEPRTSYRQKKLGVVLPLIPQPVDCLHSMSQLINETIETPGYVWHRRQYTPGKPLSNSVAKVTIARRN